MTVAAKKFPCEMSMCAFDSGCRGDPALRRFSTCHPVVSQSCRCGLRIVFQVSFACIPVLSQLSRRCLPVVVSQMLSPNCLQGFSICSPVLFDLSPRCGFPVVSQLSPSCLVDVVSQMLSQLPPRFLRFQQLHSFEQFHGIPI